MATITFPRGASVALATLSRPSKGIYILSMHNVHNNLMDNRLTPEFIKHSLLPALDEVELSFRRDFARGDKDAALVITGERSKGKFFSNGLQLDLVNECPGFFKDYYYMLMSRLLTFPLCTVAAMNGHTYAGGFCLAQCTDWRVMKAERAWTCMNEINFGAPLPEGMAAILRQRLTPGTLRKVMLTAHQFTGPEALDAGIVDEIVHGDSEAVISRAIEIAQANIKHSASGVMHMIKETLYAGVTKELLKDESMRSPDALNADRLKVLTEAAISSKL